MYALGVLLSVQYIRETHGSEVEACELIQELLGGWSLSSLKKFAREESVLVRWSEVESSIKSRERYFEAAADHENETNADQICGRCGDLLTGEPQPMCDQGPRCAKRQDS